MFADGKLKVVLCWHMHQPHYLEPESGRYQLPWTYLHAIKDYVDMVALLEADPDARAVVNFAPTLLEQIDDYAANVRDYLDNGVPLRDPLLAALASTALPMEGGLRLELIKQCLRANELRLIKRFPVFEELVGLARSVDDRPLCAEYMSSRYLADLLVWYHLAWLGETVRRDDTRIQSLIDKGRGFSHYDRRLLLGIIAELLDGVLGRYRRLAELGRIELSVTPYAHPMAPLLLDFHSAREAEPKLPVPPGNYPGGEERLCWHIEEGLRVFEQHFGCRPQGCWPAEGGVSREALGLLGQAGFSWIASGGRVLHHSLERSGMSGLPCIHTPYSLKPDGPVCFFRDDGLSDLIGFRYADWHAKDAVNDLIRHLESIADACRGEPNRIVSIIMDGENAWEYYPENGYHFLTTLYRRLAEHPGIELTTFSQALEDGIGARHLSELVAGSWVYGNFSTWMGDPDKNRGWELLIAAKQAFDEAKASGRLAGEALKRAERQLGVCEGSDWFWWFGDYNPADSVRDFDYLYRQQLSTLYTYIGAEPPDELETTISNGSGAPAAGGAMRPGTEGFA